MYYLRIENGEFGFVVEGIHEILESDIQISTEEYREFFERQDKEQFRLRGNVQNGGKSLFDVIEAFELEPAPVTPSEIESLKLALVEAVEKQEADKLELQLAMAELIESQMNGGN